jgi:NTP pyrophosphatase (non-canonical NTP hydrolase)
MTEQKHINFERYKEFVDAVTSDASKDYYSFAQRLALLNDEGVDINRLLTAAVGISAEGGEFMEIVKKIIFQGKPANQDNLDHLKIELGDVLWYVAQACIALGVNFDEVLETNVNKLMKRYPGGSFDIYYSENRKADDR